MTNQAYEAQLAEDQREEHRPTSWNPPDNWLSLDLSRVNSSIDTGNSNYSAGLFATFAGRSIDAGRSVVPAQETLAATSLFSDALNGFEQEMKRFTAEQARDFERLKREYVFEDPAATENFLTKHRSLVEVLIDAVPHMRRCFGGEITLKIRVVFEDAGPTTVSAVALWEGTLNSATESLAQFDESWWLDNVKRARGRIVFDYELA